MGVRVAAVVEVIKNRESKGCIVYPSSIGRKVIFLLFQVLHYPDTVLETIMNIGVHSLGVNMKSLEYSFLYGYKHCMGVTPNLS